MRRIVLALVLGLALPAFAVQPDEILADQGLEQRARAITAQLRCPVCQGETIDDSNAPISRDLRIYVRERLVAGDTDQATIDAVVARYGEFVLFNPKPTGSGLVLWLAGPVLLISGLLLIWGAFRRNGTKTQATQEAPLTEDERAALAHFFAKDPDRTKP